MRSIIMPSLTATKRYHLGLAATALATVLCSACKAEEAPVAAAPPEVVVAAVEQRDVPVVMELVGETRGAQDVEIRARVEGFLDSMNFGEGTLVRKGQLLYRIDPKPFEATLANARADLATAQARLEKTQGDVKRLQPLAAQQAVSQQELDNALASRDAATAQVDAESASADKARLDLGYTSITSPIDGLIGTTLVRAGSLVGRGESTLLTTVSQIDPVLFRAGISEAEYLRLSRKAEEIRKQRGDKPVLVDLILADGSVHSEKGRLDAIERAVDAATGTLSLQFRFPNPGGLIRPGQYGRARFVFETKPNALLVPQRAVLELQNLYNIYVVDSGNKLAVKTVTVGPRVGSQWVIETGLTARDQVVVEGAQRLRPGTVVTVKQAPAATTGNEAAKAAAGAEGK